MMRSQRLRASARLLALGLLASAPGLAQTNVALNKPTWASSTFENMPPGRAVDTDTYSFWYGGAELYPWLAMDLQRSYTISRAKVQFAVGWPQPSSWKVQVWSGSAWTDVYSEDPAVSGGLRDVTFPATCGRLWRVLEYTPGGQGQIFDLQLFEPTTSRPMLSANPKPMGAGTVKRNPDLPTYTSGTAVTLTATPSAGYTFTGWSGDASGTTNPLTMTLSANKVVTATFASTTTTNVALKRLATASYSDQDMDPSAAVDGSGSTYWAASTGDDTWLAVDLENNCVVSQAKVSFPGTSWPAAWHLQCLVNGAWVELYSETLSNGGTHVATFPAKAARQFRILMNYAPGGYYQVNEFQLIGQTTANYSLNTAINLSASGSVTASPNSVSYAPGSTVSLTATPASGYHFTGWSGDGSGTTNPISLTMGADKVVTANFASNTSYTLTTAISGAGSVVRTPNASSYPARTVVGLAPTPSGNYWFTGWSGDLTGTQNPASLTITKPDTVTATFTTATCGTPTFQGTSWNDGDTIQYNNNCYNYANNVRTDTFATPGLWSGHSLTPDVLDAAHLDAFVKGDGLVPTTRTATLPYGRTRVCLVVDPYFDFHWYRQNSDGYWTHKPGGDVATNVDNSGLPITNPDTADRGIYVLVVGYYSICSGSAPFGGHSTIQ